MKKSILAFLIFSAATSLTGQNVHLINDASFPESEQEEVVQKIKDKVTTFMDYLGDIAMKGGEVPYAVKVESRAKALKLFIANGDAYNEFNPVAQRTEYNTGVKMETFVSKRSRIRRTDLMRNYLQTRINKSQERTGYKQIIIEQADAIRVDNLVKVGPGKYQATAHVLQRFCGYGSDGFIRYEDHTLKTVTVHIEALEEQAPDGSLVRWWSIRLGDFSCDDVW